MRIKLLQYLSCPYCNGMFALDSFEGNRDIIIQGSLLCNKCGRIYPIIDTIPRILPDQILNSVIKYHIVFFRRFNDKFKSITKNHIVDSDDNNWWNAEKKTIESYSYQWNKFKFMIEEWEDVFKFSIQPIEPSFFKDKFGLDAGCGFGRSMYYALKYGAEMIGIDLSNAVKAASENLREFRNVHLIQADIFHLPFKEDIFNFIYNIGVLQHLPDPKKGFVHLTKYLKKESPIFIWVYAKGKGRQIRVLNLVRKFSTRIPLKILNVICFILAGLQYIVWIIPYKIFSKYRYTRKIAQKIPFASYAKFPFKVLYTDWFDGLSVPLQNYYTKDEIRNWYETANLVNIDIKEDWQGRAIGYKK